MYQNMYGNKHGFFTYIDLLILFYRYISEFYFLVDNVGPIQMLALFQIN